MKKVYLGLGTNLGDRTGYLSQAIQQLVNNPHIELIKKSSVYETAPIGYVQQEPFLNMVLEVFTSLKPFDLLVLCQEIELLLNRKKTVRWGPRTIDIDILLYENLYMATEALTIPHPRIEERAFVLVPLQEIAPAIEINGVGINALIRQVDTQDIRLYHAQK